MAVIQFAQKIPSAIAPMLAGVVITLGAIAGGEELHAAVSRGRRVRPRRRPHHPAQGQVDPLTRALDRPDLPAAAKEATHHAHRTLRPGRRRRRRRLHRHRCYAAALVEGPRRPRHPHRVCGRSRDRRRRAARRRGDRPSSGRLAVPGRCEAVSTCGGVFASRPRARRMPRGRDSRCSRPVSSTRTGSRTGSRRSRRPSALTTTLDTGGARPTCSRAASRSPARS